MIYGPTIVYKCPTCDNLLSNQSLLSGNTFGAKIFSDGMRIAPMLPEYSSITKCKKCSTIFWLSKNQKAGEYELSDLISVFSKKQVNPQWLQADYAEFLTIDDYHNALQQGIAKNRGEEFYIREQLWRSYNDRLRKGEEIFTDENDEIRWKENVLKLTDMLDINNINQKIMLAELNRNLGHFEVCMKMISEIENEEMKWLKEKLIQECLNRNRWVIRLK